MRALNQMGFIVTSRAVLADPPDVVGLLARGCRWSPGWTDDDSRVPRAAGPEGATARSAINVTQGRGRVATLRTPTPAIENAGRCRRTSAILISGQDSSSNSWP